jgi:uncharacterized protein YjbI with pentapeptide repeats
MSKPADEQRLRAAVQAGDRAADLSGCDFTQMRFTSLRLPGGNFTAANLSAADLSGAYLSDANFQAATLTKARLVLVDFRRANLVGANLSSAQLNSAILTGANLSGANLSRASLVRARLEGADLTGANLARADLRGALGLTVEQITAAKQSETAIFDERQLASLNRQGDIAVARHGKPKKTRNLKYQLDLSFRDPKPTFGDLFVICGDVHPDFPPQGNFSFAQLASLGIEQTDDYFAVCKEGEPVIWIFPLIRGEVVYHHHGPFDGLRLKLDRPSYKKHWEPCVAHFQEVLRDHIVPPNDP